MPQAVTRLFVLENYQCQSTHYGSFKNDNSFSDRSDRVKLNLQFCSYAVAFAASQSCLRLCRQKKEGMHTNLVGNWVEQHFLQCNVQYYPTAHICVCRSTNMI